MNSRVDGYIRALETGSLNYYHDLQDYKKGRLPKEVFKQKWKV